MRTAAHLVSRLGLAAGLSVLACQHPVVKRLQGTWRGDGVENVNREQLAEATGWAKGTAMEFSGSRVKILIPTHEPRAARYDVARVRGDRVLLALHDCRQCNGEPLRLILDQYHLLRWDIGDDRYVVMHKLEEQLPLGL